MRIVSLGKHMKQGNRFEKSYHLRIEKCSNLVILAYSYELHCSNYSNTVMKRKRHKTCIKTKWEKFSLLLTSFCFIRFLDSYRETKLGYGAWNLYVYLNEKKVADGLPKRNFFQYYLKFHFFLNSTETEKCSWVYMALQ